jgi:hypothetical protein
MKVYALLYATNHTGRRLDFRYIYGLKDISDLKSEEYNIEHEYKNRVFQFGLGYKF